MGSYILGTEGVHSTFSPHHLRANVAPNIPVQHGCRINYSWYFTYSTSKLTCGISGKLKSNTDFHCRGCLEVENGRFQSVLMKEVVTELNVKLECVTKFCYLGDTLGAGGGAEEAARARVRCA